MAASAAPSPAKASKRTLWLALGLLAVAAAVGISFLPVAQWVQALRGWIEAQGAIGYVVFAAAFVAAAVLLLPTWPLSVAGGLAFGVWGFVWVPLSAALAASAAFLISRYFARGRIRDWMARKPRYRAIDRAIGEEGWKVVALLRLSPLVPFNFMNYFCGMTRVAFLPYAVATLFGTFPVTAMYVYLGFVGQSVASGGMGPMQWALLGAGLVATIAVTILITRKVRTKLRDEGFADRGAQAA